MGGIFLMYLGFRMIKNQDALALINDGKRFDLRKCCAQGFMSNVLNPKIALFFMAFLPRFISGERSNQSLYMLSLGFLLALMTLMVFMILVSFAVSLGV